ncbi:MAG TPA: cytochrome b [Patescibacteria group bacterium]|nr:cytochrome b [Patescibacteria group bacterium]
MNKSDHYTGVAKALHWTMAAVIVVAWIIGYYASTLVYGVDAAKAGTITLHKSIATLTLFLIVARVLWRLTHRPPALTGMSPITQTAAHAGHFLLYGVMVALPVVGWGYSSAAGYDVPVAGLFHIPRLVAKNDALRDIFKAAHFWLAWGIFALVLGHVGFALKHRFIDRDGTLASMLPRRS